MMKEEESPEKRIRIHMPPGSHQVISRLLLNDPLLASNPDPSYGLHEKNLEGGRLPHQATATSQSKR